MCYNVKWRETFVMDWDHWLIRGVYNWKLFDNFIFICSFSLIDFFTSGSLLTTSTSISDLQMASSVPSIIELFGWLCPTIISLTTLFVDSMRAVQPVVWFVHRQYIIPNLLKWNSYWFILNWARMLENFVCTYCSWYFGPFKISPKFSGIKFVRIGLMRGRPLPRFGLSSEREGFEVGNKKIETES